MKQTAMQEFIEWVDTIIAVLPNESLGAKSQMIIAKLKAESMLKEEKEQIIRARQDGLDNGFSNGSWDSNLYYKETYK